MSDKDRLNLVSMLDSIKKVIEYSKIFNDADDFYENQRDFDAAMMNFIIIGEMVSRMSDQFIEQNNQIDWIKIRSFRNIVAHNYFGIDAEEVWQIIQNDMPKLLIEIEAMLNN